MIQNPIFSLNGTGYLHDVIRKDNKTITRINVINKFNSANESSEDIWVDCFVNDDRFASLLRLLEKYLLSKKTIIIQFQAEYSGFGNCHAGITDADPNYIVQLKANLIGIPAYFIDGKLNEDGVVLEPWNNRVINLKKHA